MILKLIISILLVLLSCPAWAGGVMMVMGNGGATADVTAPTLTSITIGTNGTSWTFAYSENVTGSPTSDLCGAYTAAMTTAGAITLTYASGDGTSSVVCSGSPTVNSGDTVANGGVDYTQPGNGIEDSAGNDLASLTDKAVTNNSTQGAGASPTYVAKAWNAFNLGGVSKGTWAEPAGAAENDIILIVALTQYGSAVNVCPSGWSTVVFADRQESVPPWGVNVCGIRRGASAPSLVSTDNIYWVEGDTVLIRGAKTTGTAWAGTKVGPPAVTHTPANPNTPSIAAHDYSLVLSIGAAWDNLPATYWTMPSGYSEIEKGHTSGAAGVGIGYKAITSAATEDPGGFTGGSSSGDYCAEISVEIISQ
jgi:hypothetical protein